MEKEEIKKVVKNLVDSSVFLMQYSLVEACLSNQIFDYDEIENFYKYPEYVIEKFGRLLIFKGGSMQEKEQFFKSIENLKNDSQALLELGGISESVHLSNIEEIEDLKHDFDMVGEKQEEVLEWYAISEFLYQQLKIVGGTVLNNEYGYWYGRSDSGESLEVDFYLIKVAEKLIKEQKNL